MIQNMSGIDRHSFAHWFIIAAITKTGKEKGKQGRSFKSVKGWKDLSRENSYIEFKINGVDVDFLDMMERIKQAFDSEVKDEAKELVKDKLAEIEQEFSNISNMTIAAIKEKFGEKEEEY